MHQSASLLERLFSLMKIAAYVTWAAVLVLLLDSSADRFLVSRGVALGCMAGFLAAFVLKEVAGDRSPAGRLLLAVEGALALTTCAVWSDTLAPILVVVFMADVAMCLSAGAIVAIGIVANLLLWWIGTELWEMRGAWRVLLAYVGFEIFATLTAWYARQTEETSRALREAHAHLLATRSLLEESARDRERLRLARELHDVAGHKLTALKLNLTALQREEPGRAQLDVSAQLATELLADIRGVVAQIRQHDGLDIRAALTQLVAPFPAPPVIHLDLADDARVESVAQAETILRVVQEAITNVVRHAAAKNAWVEMRRDGAAIRLQVRDDGRAELPLHEGFGLAGMRERLAPLAGHLQISRSTHGGVALDVSLPVDP